ncbi:signal peptidase I [Alteromonas sp. ASW11-36]|uniref:Signal peptidase I n=1 Tax=Alteromonas arenosi TaxID=3055817 RepID=A0ABT7SUS5_9ALTE|nr:signal peptidase I [Alteromonas sp. ASW11-36]MDM7859759.1 signal peptidase I [Alteromonas sp. ASW11-36]
MANYFSLLLVVLTAVTGLVWLIDHFFFAQKRRQQAVLNSDALAQGDSVEVDVPDPYWVDTSKQIFPVIAFVLVLRSFIYEPFQIPSGSMMPTLLVGDFILVEKFAYGLKDPVTRTKWVETGKPERGDVVVFKYPVDGRTDYIKRVVGLPGDTVIYRDKQIHIKPACESNTDCPASYVVPLSFVSNDEFAQGMVRLERYTESLGDVAHDILKNPGRPMQMSRYAQQPGTRYNEWIVPAESYFVMGDNRDNSTDSRFWGFVEDEHLVGKAVAIWISFEFERTDEDALPTWIPTGVRFNRVGGID